MNRTATSGEWESLGLPEIYKKKGRPTRDERTKMRRAYKASAQKHGDTIGAMGKQQYKKAVRNALFISMQAKRRERENNKLHSLNPEKAAKVQAIRDAWARVTGGAK